METNLKEKIEQFLKEEPEAEVRAYEYGIPTGEARTKGYGNPKEIRIILCGPNFKTRNSPHLFLEFVGSFRADYGAIRGNCAKVREEAQAKKVIYEKMVGEIRAKITCNF